VQVFGRLGALLDLSVGFHSELTGRENAVMAGILGGLTRRQVLQRLDAIVEFAELAPFIDNPVRTYSSGMQMRLAFSAAVHTDPEVLLLDEVLSVGDLAFQQKCLDRMMEFRSRGCTILLVSHDAAVVEELCDQALWLHGGHLAAHGEVSDVVGRYVTFMRGE
jgi:lipopolysaccharide transport system ATP-binding protein